MPLIREKEMMIRFPRTLLLGDSVNKRDLNLYQGQATRKQNTSNSKYGHLAYKK